MRDGARERNEKMVGKQRRLQDIRRQGRSSTGRTTTRRATNRILHLLRAPLAGNQVYRHRRVSFKLSTNRTEHIIIIYCHYIIISILYTRERKLSRPSNLWGVVMGTNKR